jgi:hypothetical protein
VNVVGVGALAWHERVLVSGAEALAWPWPGRTCQCRCDCFAIPIGSIRY